MVDAARVDAHTMSLLVAARPQEAEVEGAPTRESPPSGDLAPVHSYEVTVAGASASGEAAVRVGETSLAVLVNGRRRWGRKDEGAQAGSGPQRIVAPMPGRITRVLVKKGEPVRPRQPVIVIEAMKMENELRAAAPGTMAEIHVQDGQSVEAGALLAVIHQ
jgi:pyruvate carboxylase subunit B